MNFAHSSQLNQLLKKQSFSEVQSYDNADIIIINACSVREHAEKKVFNRLNYFNSFKKKNNHLKLLVTGCFAQNNKENIMSDIVIGPSRINKIPDILKEHKGDRYLNVEVEEHEFLRLVKEEKFPFRCLVDITKGCDNYCSYCIVPYVRGHQVSRKSNDIIKDVKELSEKGVKEIVLLGQNVNSYGKDNQEISFSELLFKLNQINGIERIKFFTSNPKDFSDDIISAVIELKKIISYIHLPIQSGSDKILKLMNRQYNISHYYNIVDKIRSYKQDFSLSTDFLVGFPGEKEDDFLNTIDVAKKIRFNEAFMFKYSSRPNVASNDFVDQVPEEEKGRRLEYLIHLQKKIVKEKAKENINKIRTILIENKSKKDKSKFVGRDELNYQVIVDERVEIGNTYQVKIIDVRGQTLMGQSCPR